MPLIKWLSHITFLSNTKRHTEVYFSKQKFTTELLSFMSTKNEKKHYQLAGLIQTSHQSSSFDQYLELSSAFLLREKDRDARHLHPRVGTKDRRIISKQMRDKRKISLFPTKILPEDRIYHYAASQQKQDTAPSPEALPCRGCAGCPPPSPCVWLTSQKRRCPRSRPPLLSWGVRRFSVWNLSNLNSTEE